ncbi:hypothetical protein SCYAM73S_04457 [Streptomyces cyaneofuscatus]
MSEEQQEIPAGAVTVLELNKSGTDLVEEAGRLLPTQRTGPDPATAERVPLRPYLITGAVLCGLYFLYSYLQYSRFGSPSWDLGIFEQEVRAYADIRAPIVDIKGPGYLILGDHFSPIVALLAPLYWLWPSAESLLFAQAAFFALGAVIVISTTRVCPARGPGRCASAISVRGGAQAIGMRAGSSARMGP